MDNKNQYIIFSALLIKLRVAIIYKNKRSILSLYDKLESFDLDSLPDDLFKRYNRLVSEANDILYTIN